MITNDEFINIRYILSVKVVNDKIVLEKDEIEYPKDIKDILNKLNDYEESCVYDILSIEDYIRDCGNRFDGVKISGKYSYCWPNEYNASFLSKAEIKSVDRNRYFKELDEIKKRIETEYRAMIWSHKVSLSDYEKRELEKEKNKKIEEKQEIYKKSAALKYIQRVRRFFYAQHYYITLNRIKGDCKMYSSDAIGWYKPNYNITGNARIGIRSNFGYGKSAYFDILLTYKGINILPYSDLVNYYWSNMMDNVRYTRSYFPRRRNWEDGLRFVVDICNWIERDSASFEKKWIVSEVENMMDGLKTINENVNIFYNKLKEAKERERRRLLDEDGRPQAIRYSYIHDADICRHKIYPYETTLIIQVDKLSAALSLLEELLLLKDIYSPVILHIKTIIRYNKDVITAIITEIEELCKQIVNKQKSVEMLKKNMLTLQMKKEIRENEIIAKLKADDVYKSLPKVEKEEMRSRTYESDKEHCLILNEILKLKGKINEEEQDIRERNNFKSHLENKMEYITNRLIHWEDNK